MKFNSRTCTGLVVSYCIYIISAWTLYIYTQNLYVQSIYCKPFTSNNIYPTHLKFNHGCTICCFVFLPSTCLKWRSYFCRFVSPIYSSFFTYLMYIWWRNNALSGYSTLLQFYSFIYCPFQETQCWIFMLIWWSFYYNGY